MPLYDVHIYREMRLRFDKIEADSPETAANIARDRLTEDADDIQPCHGETFFALVDIVGDDEHENSQVIDYEPERARKAADQLLTALEKALPILEAHATNIRLGSGGLCRSEAYDEAVAVIAKVKGGAQ